MQVAGAAVEIQLGFKFPKVVKVYGMSSCTQCRNGRNINICSVKLNARNVTVYLHVGNQHLVLQKRDGLYLLSCENSIKVAFVESHG